MKNYCREFSLMAMEMMRAEITDLTGEMSTADQEKFIEDCLEEYDFEELYTQIEDAVKEEAKLFVTGEVEYD